MSDKKKVSELKVTYLELVKKSGQPGEPKDPSGMPLSVHLASLRRLSHATEQFPVLINPAFLKD